MPGDPAARRPALARIPLVAGHPEVYEPSDDSFALADALAAALGARPAAPRLCVEVGSGSGYVVCSLALLLRQAGARSQCLAVDVSPAACACTQATLAAHQGRGVDSLVCDLLGPLLPRLAGSVDLLVFNPPYVPTPAEEVRRPGIARAWAGGWRGREVTDRFLPQVPRLLAPGGECFLVAVHENEPAEICCQMERLGLQAGVVLRRRADEEQLSILRFQAPAA